jgi:Raf kinase inhibitor-like YbhB/YbcL family protein
MSPEQRFTIALSLGCLLASAACGDDPKPAASETPDSGASASDAGALDAAAAADSGASGTDGGTEVVLDSGGPNSDSGLRASDGAVSSISDAASDGATVDAGSSGDAGPGGAATFSVMSPAFENVAGCAKDMAASCKVFPEENVSYMRDAASETENISPELTWTGVPAGTKSFAVVLQDLTNGMAHWVLWNVPGGATKLDKNVAKSSAMPALPAGSQQCNASFATGTSNGYYGPGSRCNVYEFVIYALSRPMFSPTPATDAGQVRTQLQALGADILATASLRGRANYMMMCAN